MTASMPATDLARDSMPVWLVNDDTLPRINGRMGKTGESLSWRFIMHVAIEESGLRAPYRSVLNVLTTFKPNASWSVSTIADRAGLVRQTASRMLRDLEDWGWLFIERDAEEGKRAGRKSRYVLAVPVDRPPDRVHGQRVTNGDTLQAVDNPVICEPRGGQRVADGDTYVSRPATPVSQMATRRVADGDTRNEEPGNDEEPTSRRPGSHDDEAARWMWVVRRIEELVPSSMMDATERRYAADVICGFHGIGLSDDTLFAVVSSSRAYMAEKDVKMRTALAHALDIPRVDLEHLREVHHLRRSTAGAA